MTCTQCGQATLSDGVCVDCSNKRFNDSPRLKNIVDRLQEYVSFECNPSYPWSAKKVYDDLNKILDPDYKPSRALELDEIKTPRLGDTPF
jgi:hypothetical protein